jgi:hypothetical protein
MLTVLPEPAEQVQNDINVRDRRLSRIRIQIEYNTFQTQKEHPQCVE